MSPHSPHKIIQNNHQNNNNKKQNRKRAIQEQLRMLTQIYSATQLLPILSFNKK